MLTRTRVGTALVLLSAVLAVVFAFIPAQFNSSTISWRPDSGAASGAMQLTRGAPERIVVETSCDLARKQGGPESVLLDTGSLSISVTDQRVRAGTTSDGPFAEATLPAGSCAVRAAYSLESSLLTLSIDGTEDAVEVAPPTIYRLYTTTPPSISRVTIETQETGLAASWPRWVVGFTAIGALLAGALLLRLPTRRQRARTSGGASSFIAKFSLVDGFVLVSVTALSLITPPLIDDGWIINRSDALRDRWWFGELYDASDAWLPQGSLHELVLTSLQAAGLDLALLRLVIALQLAVTWILLRRAVLVPAIGEASSRWAAAAATYVAFAGAWLITVRQEPLVVLFATISLAVAVSHERSTKPGWVFVGLFAAGLALSTHQTGWVAVAPAGMIVWSIWGEFRRDRRSDLRLLVAVIAAGTAVVVATFAAADVRTVLEGIREFSKGQHSAGVLDEATRYVRVLGSSGARVSTLFLLMLWCLAGSLGINAADERSKRLWVLSMLWLAGLLLTSSKWEWHFGVYAIPAACLAALTGVELNREDRRSGLGTGAVLPMGVLVAGIGMTYAGAWNLRDLSSPTWGDLSNLLLGSDHRVYWYAAAFLTFVLGLVADRRHGRWRRPATAALSLCILFPIGASAAWLIADAVKPGWSPVETNLHQVSSDAACGALDGVQVDAEVTALSRQSAPVTDEPLVSEAFPRIERISSGPLGGQLPTWGTWAPEKDGSSPDARTGLFRSPTFGLDGARDITVWSAFGSADQLWARVVFTDASGGEEATNIPPNATPQWSILQLAVPDGAREVRIEVDDQNTGFGGWLAVSTPAVAADTTASAVMRGATGYVDPLVASQVPCLDLPDLSQGYWRHVDYLTSDGRAFALANVRDLTVTEVACRPYVLCLQKLDYPMAEVSVTTS